MIAAYLREWTALAQASTIHLCWIDTILKLPTL